MAQFVPRRFKKYGEVFGGAMWFYIRTSIANNCESIYYNDFDPYEEMDKKSQEVHVFDAAGKVAC